ncbi:MAG TPA: hypothetical protein VJ440_06270 [Candidatus Brocadiaceae bacterium]|nr:hypothetical protein [Candidatus Brocadiaceae bacterium]
MEVIDPDYELVLRPAVEEELQESMVSKERIPVEDVATGLGLHMDFLIKTINYENTLSFIYSFYRSSRSGGSRPLIMKQIINDLGINSAISPHGVVQITGTNGKGICTRQVEADLIASGRDVITLVSPHITTFCERIRLNGCPISREMLGDIVESLAKGLNNLRVREISPTPVEIAFLVALRLRMNRGLETCLVIEAGCGGATDYTNVFNRTIVGLTRIGRDHLDLFHDLIALTREKVGLSNSGGILVSVNQLTEVKDVIKQECESRNIKIEWLVMHSDPNLSPHMQAWRENQALANRLSQMVVTQNWKLGNMENNQYRESLGYELLNLIMKFAKAIKRGHLWNAYNYCSVARRILFDLDRAGAHGADAVFVGSIERRIESELPEEVATRYTDTTPRYDAADLKQVFLQLLDALLARPEALSWPVNITNAIREWKDKSGSG